MLQYCGVRLRNKRIKNFFFNRIILIFAVLPKKNFPFDTGSELGQEIPEKIRTINI